MPGQVVDVTFITRTMQTTVAELILTLITDEQEWGAHYPKAYKAIFDHGP